MLTTEQAMTLLGGARKELPSSPQTPEEILEAMKVASHNYYREAIATNCHTFIEFTGLINEYIKICERNLKQRGVHFTKTSVHTPGEAELQIENWELQYINDKLRCIFPNLQLVEIEETKNTQINCERIGNIVDSSVSSILCEAYGSDFSAASQKERLLFVEVIAFCLRVDCEFNEALILIFGQRPNLPASIYTSAKVEINEGLKLMAVLQMAIIEAYSVKADATDKLRGNL